MGHLGHLRAEYRELVDRLSAGSVGLPKPKTQRARRGWQEILEILFTPEDAALAAKMPIMPSSLKKIASRVDMPEDQLRSRLEGLADRGVVLDLVHPETGKVRYLLAPPVAGFFEFSMMRAKDSIPKKRMAEALDAYCHGDDAFAREVFGGETVIGRTLVNETVIPEEDLPEVLDWEKATEVLSEAKTIAVSLCYCRHKNEHLGKKCDAPMDNCMSLNNGAKFVLRRKFGRVAERSEALEMLAEAREKGLVQLADNCMNRPTWLCNCCGCCCGQLTAINDFDLRAVNPSRFQATHDPETCTGCSRCSRACPIGAVSMAPARVEAKRKNALKPKVDTDRCIGCGVCVTACRKDSMRMQKRPATPKVPDTTVERVIRMALEKGRLPHLLFDQGASRGSRFLNRALNALCRLPSVERALASEQLQSRFVAYALNRGKNGPTTSFGI